ncbi:hypothetical protein ATANTOWER_013560 [Ataeniobius toweri]|uniref:Uncharacterized protein n=1 Tax=Ataeniobius toweri TaxID=208326 RepID=A0ABU7B6Z3_9TELE|nr:hypothetical protein [Ataeniobius toweri]
MCINKLITSRNSFIFSSHFLKVMQHRQFLLLLALLNFLRQELFIFDMEVLSQSYSNTFDLSLFRAQSSFQQQQQEAPGSTRSRRALGEQEKQRLSKKICDTILCHAKDKFSFTSHLVSTVLLDGELFDQHQKTFPEEALNTTVRAYPVLHKEKLRTELSLIYESPDFRGCRGAVALYQVLQSYNIQKTFSEPMVL